MKYLLTFLSILIIHSFIFAQSWSINHTVVNEEFNHINFLDANTGWAFRKGGLIKTTDGGTTWLPQSMGTGEADFRILDSHIFNANTVVAVGRHESLEAVAIKTTDGGATWTAQTNFPERLFALAFRNANDGWAVGDKGIGYKTADGGSTWTAASFSNDDLLGIDFADANTGVAVGEEGLIMRTTDGGTTWSQVSSGITTDLHKVRFSDATHGWAVGMNGVILATTDGGATWSAQNSSIAFNLNDVVFLDNSKGWAAGILGNVVFTIDGGTNWSTVNTGITAEVLSIDMVSELLGWATDVSGNIWKFDGMTNTFNIIENNVLSIMPNPILTHANIQLKNGDNIEKIWVYNAVGQLIKTEIIQQKQTVFYKDNLLSGTYILKIETSNDQFVIQKIQIF